MDNRKVWSRKGGKLTKRAAADHVFVHFYFSIGKIWTRDAMIFDSRFIKDPETNETHLYTRCINFRLCSCFATLPRIGSIENESRTTLFAVPSRHLDTFCIRISLCFFRVPSTPLPSLINNCQRMARQSCCQTLCD